MTVFGRILHGGQVEDAALATLRAWLPTYLAELERQTGREPGSLPRIRSWSLVSDFSVETEDQLPAGLIVSAGLAEEPERDGERRYAAVWALGVGVITSARDQVTTRRLAMTYAAAIRAVLVQRPALGGLADFVDWIDERYDDVPDDAGRSLAAGRVTFRIGVGDVVTAAAGPSQPDPLPDPLEPYETATVATAGVDLYPEGLA